MACTSSARVPFCLVVVPDLGSTLASELVSSLTAGQTVAARAVPLASVVFRADAPPDALVLALDAATLDRGAELIGRVRREAPTSVVVVTGDLFGAERLSALGAAKHVEVIRNPASTTEIAERVHRGLGEAPGCADVRTLLDPHIKGLVGTSRAFLKEVCKLPTIAGCDAGVLILGETGTGKEVCAQAIHYLSARASRPWVAVNCGAIPNELVEDELFGHVRGAYTTAHAERHGLVHEAEGGTLFLDDVDALARGAQAKLLRFLQEKEYRPVGSNTVHRANVRVIAASNHRLAEMAREGAFRQDLFFRLNVLTLQLPPLRERREDVVLLAQDFVAHYALQWNRKVEGFTAAARRRMQTYAWPGNVRELKHVVERAVLLAEGPLLGPEDIELGDRDAPPQDEPFQRAKARVIEEFERTYIEQLLVDHQGNITRAAQAARKNRRAFWQLIRKHHIEPQRFRAVVS